MILFLFRCWATETFVLAVWAYAAYLATTWTSTRPSELLAKSGHPAHENVRLAIAIALLSVLQYIPAA